MNDQIKAGAEIHAGDGGYSEGTREGYEAFVKIRNQSLESSRSGRIHVVAGTYEQFCLFSKQLLEAMREEGISVRASDIVYVANPDQLRGYRSPWGYKVGTWSDRADIWQIADCILVAGSSFLNDFIEVEL